MILSVIIALSLDQHIYEDIIRTRSNVELTALTEVLEKGGTYKTKCISEIVKNHFPRNCMLFLKLVKNSKYNRKLKTRRANRLLKRYCMKDDLTFEFSQPGPDSSLTNLYPDCIRRYSDKLKDVEYKKTKR